ncbi:MFS general substrate transporter [Ramaria rubella]|nr:MFS general substrate transporter [Ramaria rubella]
MAHRAGEAAYNITLEPPLPSTEHLSSKLTATELESTGYQQNASSTSEPTTLVSGVPVDYEKGSLKTPVERDDVYDRFSKQRKRAIVAVVSFAALLAPFASSSFFPSIPQISTDLDVSQSVINYTVAVYLVVLGVAPLAWSPYSTMYGRQKIYLISFPVFIAGSIGVAESRSLVVLIMTRIIQGVGSSSVLAVGAGSIGDIYRPTERGRAMGIFYAGALLGPAISPVLAGVMTEYVHGSRGSWRAFQYLLAAMGLFCFILTVVFLPETSHHLGIDALKSANVRHGKKPRWMFEWLNPLKPLKLLRYRNVLAISLTSSFILLSTYAILIPLTYTLGPRFGITNEAILGTFYLAPGVGNIVGSRLSGYLSDATVARWIKRRSSLRVPEDRLRASLVAGGIVTPISLIGAGLTMQFWTNAGGLAMSLVFLFTGGMGLIGVIAVCNTYLVDVMQDRSAEVIATNNCLRYVASACASAAVLPLIQTIGVAPTNAIAAAIGLIGFGFMCATIRYGEGWRETGIVRAGA